MHIRQIVTDEGTTDVQSNLEWISGHLSSEIVVARQTGEQTKHQTRKFHELVGQCQLIEKNLIDLINGITELRAEMLAADERHRS